MLDSQVIKQINDIFEGAAEDSRTVLYEHEVYRMLSLIGLETPMCEFIDDDKKVDDEMVRRYEGKMVLKVVSRDLAHKQKYGGVRVLKTKDPLYVRYVMGRHEAGDTFSL